MKRSLILKVVDAGLKKQNAAAVAAYIIEGAILGFGDGKMVPWRVALGMPLLLAVLGLTANHKGGRAVQARHLIFSQERGLTLRESLKQLLQVWRDWRLTYAPDRSWLGGIHKYKGGYHLHIALENTGPDGRALKLRPHQVASMAKMEFTAHAVSAEGTGKSKSLRVYPMARQLDVRDLAARLVAEDGSLKPRGWDQLVETNDVSEFRRRADGSIISFLYEGRRIRLSTLGSFIERRQRELLPEFPATPQSEPAKSDPAPKAKPAPISKASPALIAEINRQLRLLSARTASEEKENQTQVKTMELNPENEGRRDDHIPRKKPRRQIDPMAGSDAAEAVNAAARASESDQDQRDHFRKCLAELDHRLSFPSCNPKDVRKLYLEGMARRIHPCRWSDYWPLLHKLTMAGTWPLGRDSVMIWRLHGKELQLTSPVLPPSQELWEIVKKLYPYALAIQFVEDHETAFDDAGRTKAFDYLMKHAQRYPGWFPEEELGKHAGDLSPFVKVSREPIAEFGRDLYEIMSQMPQPALLFTPCEHHPCAWALLVLLARQGRCTGRVSWFR